MVAHALGLEDVHHERRAPEAGLVAALLQEHARGQDGAVERHGQTLRSQGNRQIETSESLSKNAALGAQLLKGP